MIIWKQKNSLFQTIMSSECEEIQGNIDLYYKYMTLSLKKQG